MKAPQAADRVETGTERGSRTRNYLSGLCSGYVLTLATILVGLWLTPFTLRFLDRERYAVFALAGDLLTWLSLLDLGITAALRARAAHLSGQPDPERLNRLASAAFFAQAVVVMLAMLTGAGLSSAFPHLYAIRPVVRHEVFWLLSLMVAGLGLSLGTQTFSALLIAHQQVHVDNLLGLLNLFIRTVTTVILLQAGWGLCSLGVAYLAAKAVSSALAVARVYRLLPGLRIRPRYVTGKMLAELAGLGMWFSLGGVAGVVITSLDRAVTAKVISLEMVTTLTLTGRLYALCGGLLEQMTNTARPMMGQLLGSMKLDAAMRAHRRLSFLSSATAIVTAASLWAGNGCFVTRWVGGTNYGGMALDAALALNVVVHAWVLPHRAVLSSGLVVRPQTLCRLAEAVLNLGLSLLLARWLGVTGIVLGTAAAGLLTSCWYLPRLTSRLLGVSGRSWMPEDAGRLLRFAVLLIPVALLFRGVGVLIGGYSGAALGAFATGLMGGIVAWISLLDDETRETTRRLVLQTARMLFHIGAAGEKEVSTMTAETGRISRQ